MKIFYTAFLLFAALEMLWEVSLSRKNSTRLLDRGAIEIAPGILPVMTMLYLLLFAGSYAEYVLRPKHLHTSWILSFGLMFLAAKALKIWAIASLGHYWTMRVLIVPESNVVTSGPYRWIRHPNYIAVTMEIAAIALVAKSYWTLTVVLLSFVIVLFLRVRSEEEALLRYTDYSGRMSEKKRFVP